MIEIVPYQDRWPGEFRAIAEKIKEALGPRALAVHHIGSTGVSGLSAKDVIDVQITVADLAEPIEEPLVRIGYEPTGIATDHCPPGMKLAPDELEKRFFRVKDRRINLHVRRMGAFNQRYPILFRDYLRATPAARNAYGEIKKQLARYFPEDAEAYYDVKDPVCDLIIAGAMDWAKATRWEPGPA